MSVAADQPEIGKPPPASTGDVHVTGPQPVGETCPLCGAPLHTEQEWCLRCGAAARTRLAASSKWKAPIVAVAVVITLSLGVLAGALVKLAGNSRATATPATTTVTTAAAPVAPATTAPSATPPPATAPSATPPAATTPSSRTTTPSRTPAEEKRRLFKLGHLPGAQGK